MIILLSGAAVLEVTKVAPAPNGIELPDGYKDWRLIAPSHRTDKNTIRAILGNDVAVEAARSGATNPWPDGSVLAKVVWKDKTHKDWEGATIPGEFVLAEFMFKDAARFEATGGWGYARWDGLEQKPYGEDASFEHVCHGCHIPMKKSDYVYTYPAVLP